MASAATVLESSQLVGIIFAYQHGIHADMRPLLSVEDPLIVLFICGGEDDIDQVNELLAPLDAVMTAWYNEWGPARISKLLACLPQMQRRVIAHALWSGNLSVLTLLPVEMLREISIEVVDFVAVHGNTTILKYLHDVVGLDVSTPGAMFFAAQYGHLDVIRYLYELNHDTDVKWAALAAADLGHLEVVEFFHTQCASCNLSRAFESALERQDLVVAQSILNLVGKDNLDVPYAMVIAVYSGHLESLEWMLQRGFYCTTNAMDLAAKYGHLDVVQWLHANRSEGCTEEAMHFAAIDGHLEIVEWLFLSRHEGCMAATLEETTRNGHWHVVRCLVVHGVVNDAQAALTIALKEKDTPADVVALLQEAVVNSSGRQRKKRCL